MHRRTQISTRGLVSPVPRPPVVGRCRQRCFATPRVDFDPFDTVDTEYDPLKLEEEEGIRMEDYIREFDSILNTTSYKFEVGQIVEGLVFDVDSSGVYVDFGGKEMGLCSNKDLALKKVPKPAELMKVDSRHLFEIRQTGVRMKKLGGEVTLLSRQGIVGAIAWKRLRLMCEFHIKLEVTVIRKNYGGYIVEDDMGVSGYLPGRQAVINPANTFEDDEVVGRKILVEILDVFEESQRYTVSQRDVLEKDSREEFKSGALLEGYVEGIMPYGAFINAGGVSGLLHNSQISMSPVTNAEDVFAINDRVKVMVLGYDRSRRELALSTKKLEPVPGAMINDPQSVYDKAEEMAEKFRKEVEQAQARVGPDMAAISGDVSIDTARLAGLRRSGPGKAR